MEKKDMIFREITRDRVLVLSLLAGLVLGAFSGSAQEPSTSGLPKNKVVATVQGLVQPSAIAISPDSTTAYVISQGHYVSVIDATNMYHVKATFEIFGGPPFGAVVSPDGKSLYISIGANSGNVLVVDTTQSTYPVTNTVIVGPYPAGLALSPDGKEIYVANEGFLPAGIEGSISVIDTAALTSTTINCNGSPLLVAFTQSGNQADVLNSVGTGFVQFIDTASGAVSPKVGVAGQVLLPGGLTSYTNTTTGAGELYISSYWNWVTVCDSTTGAVIKKILVVPSVSSEIILGQPAITRNGKYLYVPYSQDDIANSQGTEVAMVNLGTGKIVGTPITVGKNPVWAQISPDGKTLYVANFAILFGGTVSVIDITP
jgi:DNA-binding beta-propeller fold protein YncE